MNNITTPSPRQKKSRAEKLIDAGERIVEVSAKEAGELAFTSRVSALTGMPHSNQGTAERYVRNNGDIKITIVDTHKIGLPYGSIPRLLMAWAVTEAVNTKSPRLTLGNRLSEFMSEFDLVIPTGGRKGTITSLKKQTERFFKSTIIIEKKEEDKEQEEIIELTTQVAPIMRLWRKKNSKAAWQSEIVLSEFFYKEICKSHLPLDMRVLKSLKQSPFALDMYTWLTYRLRVPEDNSSKFKPITWRLLQGQFGAGYKTDEQGQKNFQRAFKRQYRNIKAVYPNINLKFTKGGIFLRGGPSIPKKLKKLPTDSSE